MEEKFITFDGYVYTCDDKTGYYLNSTTRKRLHRAIWEYHNGEIPEGFHIHHMDGDKSNNDISNLSLLSAKDHSYLHGKEIENVEKMRKIQVEGRVKAVEWHKSEEGVTWHKQHYENMKDSFHKKGIKVCECCGEEFETVIRKTSLFCSNKCRSRARRESGVDNENRNCEHCGKQFVANKYTKIRFCSKGCSNKAVVRLPQLKS